MNSSRDEKLRKERDDRKQYNEEQSAGYSERHSMLMGIKNKTSSDCPKAVNILASRSLLAQVENLDENIYQSSRLTPDYYYEQLNGKGRRLKTAKSRHVEVHAPDSTGLPTYVLDRKTPLYSPDMGRRRNIIQQEDVPTVFIEKEKPKKKLIEVDGHVIVDSRYISIKPPSYVEPREDEEDLLLHETSTGKPRRPKLNTDESPVHSNSRLKGQSQMLVSRMDHKIKESASTITSTRSGLEIATSPGPPRSPMSRPRTSRLKKASVAVAVLSQIRYGGIDG